MQRNQKEIKLIVGLGNPGVEYQNTRHNAGFDVVSRLLEKFPGEFIESHICDSRCFTGRYRGRGLALLMPQTYMNLSGEAVGPYSRRNEINPDEILVIYDDLDLPVGRLRIRVGGSSGGHHGIDSVINSLNSADFIRLRVGIGSENKSSVVDHVLTPVAIDEKPIYDESLEAAAEAAISIMARGLQRTMNEYNAWRPTVEIEEEENNSVQEKNDCTINKEVIS